MHTDEKPNIIVIGNLHSHPSAKAFLEKFVRIIKEVSNKTYVISGDSPPAYDNVSWIKLRIAPGGSLLRRFIVFMKSQIKLLRPLIKSRKDYDSAIILPTSFVLPTVFLRLAKKRVAVFVAQKSDNPVMRFLCRLNFMLSNLLIVEANNVVTDWKIEKFSRKIVIGSIFVDATFFRVTKEFWKRENVVGYVGTLIERKGISKLLESVSFLQNSKVRFVIGGIGELEDLVRKYSLEKDSISYIGLVPEEELKNFYKELKLFVLPSRSEGVPNVLLEAMACGTPVLATPVGGIPDLIKDSETGFIMESDSPECIAKNIERAINHPRLDIITKNALNLIEREYSYEAAVERYEKIIKNLCGGVCTNL